VLGFIPAGARESASASAATSKITTAMPATGAKIHRH
jgi:hypothetical protein